MRKQDLAVITSGYADSIAILTDQLHAVGDWNCDYGTGYLLHDSFGLKAEFERGFPTREIRFKMKRPDARRIQNVRIVPSIKQLTENSGNWKAVPQFSVILLHGVHVDRKQGYLVANWISVAKRTGDENKSLLIGIEPDSGTPALITVEPERFSKKTDRFNQRRLRFAPELAVHIKNPDDLFPKISDCLKRWDIPNEENEYGHGNGCILLRHLEIDGNLLFIDTMRLELHKNESVESIVENFDSFQSSGDWKEAIDSQNDWSYVDLIPYQRYFTHNSSMSAESGREDESWNYSIPDLNGDDSQIHTKNGYKLTGGLAQGVMAVRRTNETKNWMVRASFVIDKSVDYQVKAEIITPDLPQVFRDRFMKRQEIRREIMEQENE